jgi:microcystin-dependent protein
MGHIEDGIEAAHNLVVAAVPSGAITQFAGSTPPTGYLLCDGASLLRASYPDLFAALGGASSPWGLPDGTHFNVPDLQGRIPVGRGTHVDVDNLAENDGATLANRRPKHKHTVNDAGHTHGYYRGDDGTGNASIWAAQDAPGQTVDSAVTGITVGPQTNSPTDGPSFVVVNYIIKT